MDVNSELERVTDLISDQEWLEPPSSWLQKAVSSLYQSAGNAGRKIQNLLNGVWLGHPLHPVLTDATIGLWSTAVALDTIDLAGGSPLLRAGADTAVGLGVASALATAAAGLTDWQFTQGKPQRIGTVHATLNVTATILFALSMAARAGKKRRQGQMLAFIGFAGLLFSAYLGGDLVYRRKVGVDHAPSPQLLPKDWTAVIAETDLSENQLYKVIVNQIPLVLVKRGGHIFALAETCAHQGGPLSEGELRDNSVVCPWHGSRYALEDGRVLDGPSTYFQPCLETRVFDGQIEVRISPEVRARQSE